MSCLHYSQPLARATRMQGVNPCETHMLCVEMVLLNVAWMTSSPGLGQVEIDQGVEILLAELLYERSLTRTCVTQTQKI